MIKPIRLNQNHKTLEFKISELASTVDTVTIKNYGATEKVIRGAEIENYIKGDNFRYLPNSSGCYSLIVKTTNKEVFISKDPTLIFNNQDLSEFNHLSYTSSKSKERIAYYPGSELYPDWLATNFVLNSNFEGFYCHSVNNQYRIYTQVPLLEKTNGNLIYLSGYQLSDKFGFIYNNQSDNSNITQQINACNDGRYTFLELNNKTKQTTILNDYFALEKLFIYKKDGKFIVSNRLHLLLIFARHSNIDLDIDPDVISSILGSNIWMFSLNHFSRRTILENINILGIEDSVNILENGELKIQKKSIYEDFLNLRKLDRELVLNKVSSEQKNKSISIFLNNKVFIKIADLTGGVDSRLSLSTLPITQKRFKNELLLRTLKIGKDWHISNQIASYFGLSYIKAPFYKYPKHRLNLQKRSYLMGTYFKYIPIENEFIKLNSGGGKVILNLTAAQVRP